MTTTTCEHCDFPVPLPLPAPATASEWIQARKGHAASCLWVQTRGGTCEPLDNAEAWHSTSDANCRRMTELALSFPSMKDAPGLRPWNPHALDRWIFSGVGTSGNRHVVAFLLAVWSGKNEPDVWRIHRSLGHGFDVVAASSVFDAKHRAALLKWCADPWYP